MPPRAPRPAEPTDGVLRVALSYALGLWPLTCVVMLLAGLVVLSAHMGVPYR